MTRFARAKGSKASNEKVPEDGTPWEVMKEQLLKAKQESEETKKRIEAEKQRVENYEKFLLEQKVQKRKATWCDFPEVEQTKKQKNVQAQDEQSSKSKKKKKHQQNGNTEPFNNVNVSKDNVAHINNISEEVDGISSPKINKKKKHHQNGNTEPFNNGNVSKDNVAQINNVGEEVDGVSSPRTNNSEQPVSKKKKKNKKKLNDYINKKQKSNQNIVVEQSEQTVSRKATKNKEKVKENKTRVIDNAEDLHTINLSQQSEQTGSCKAKKNKVKGNEYKNKTTDNTESLNTINLNQNLNDKNNSKLSQKKKKKLKDSKPTRRKEINDRSYQLIINGKEVELMRFEGFPIMKKDAERLAELKNSMMKKGIPKSEVQRTIKLERRRAEKALARLRREVCYNCRKGGHNLSDCPDLKSKIPGVDAPDGLCFKCGSTEHRQFECKVQRDKEFRFATCFICKEAGHIARQCPDNPKGLYPNGGCCKLCGDVTHLRKDCPTVNHKKEETSVKLPTLDSTDNIEDIGLKENTAQVEETVRKPKKIKF